MATIKTVGVFSKPGVPAAVDLVPKVFHFLRQRGIDLRFDTFSAGYCDCEAGALDREDCRMGAT